VQRLRVTRRGRFAHARRRPPLGSLTAKPRAATMIHPGTAADQWWRTAVIYQIYPRSSSASAGDGAGDLQGITDRLPYLRDLGVDALWLSPFYPSPQVDGGYDISDHQDVDPLFGTLDDADELIRRAHDQDRKSTRLNSSHVSISYAVFCFT